MPPSSPVLGPPLSLLVLQVPPSPPVLGTPTSCIADASLPSCIRIPSRPFCIAGGRVDWRQLLPSGAAPPSRRYHAAAVVTVPGEGEALVIVGGLSEGE